MDSSQNTNRQQQQKWDIEQNIAKDKTVKKTKDLFVNMKLPVQRNQGTKKC